MVVGMRAGLALLALGALQRSASGAPSDHVGLHHNHMCSQPHCPLASFKQPDRPLAQLKGLLSGIRQRAMQIAVQLHRRRRAHALRQLQGEMVFGRQMRDDLFPLEASVEPAVPPPQQQPPQPAAAAAVGPDGMAALLDAGLTVVDEIVEMSGVQKPRAVSRGSPARRFLTYGNWVVDGVGFFLKMLAIVLFQVLGTALAINDFQRTGAMSRTLMGFSGLLSALAFVPPVFVALRKALPQHAHNPLVRGAARGTELVLDVVVVSALSLMFSILLTAFFALPAYKALLTRSLTDEYIIGALSASAVYCFIWMFGRHFEPLAAKWFI